MGTLHVVATPIGNLEDITLRALRVLREAGLLFAEDTRRTRVLLDHYGIEARPVSLNAHNEPGRIAQALAVLADGGQVALVSDAGTPLVSDPGARLVAAAAGAGHDVEAAPGPSAVLAALTVSGLRAHPFAFAGFLPRKAGARRKLLQTYCARRETVVFFESPHRVAETLQDLVAVFGADRRACVARELTKLHEEVVRAPLDELAGRFAEGARGEITIVVEGASGRRGMGAESESAPPDIDATIRKLAEEGRRPREIAAQLVRGTGVPRREIYARAVEVCRALDAASDDADVEGAAEH